MPVGYSKYTPEGDLHPDYVEVQNNKYLNKSVRLLVLTSGRLAVLTDYSELHTIVDTLEEALANRPIRVAYSPPKPAAPAAPKMNLSKFLEGL